MFKITKKRDKLGLDLDPLIPSLHDPFTYTILFSCPTDHSKFCFCFFHNTLKTTMRRHIWRSSQAAFRDFISDIQN